MAIEKRTAARLGAKEALQVSLILLFLYLVSLASIVIFHVLVEVASIVVAFCIFLLAWNSRRFHGHDFLLFLGIAYLFIAGIDLVHLFTSPEFAITKGYDVNLSQQVRVAGRFLESLSFVLAFSVLSRKIQVNTVFWGYLVVFFGFLFSIFYWKSFPAVYTFESGATFFKDVSDCATILIFVVALGILFRRRREFSPLLANLFMLAVVFQAAGVAIHSPFAGSYSLPNFFGLSFRLIAFFFLYKAVIEIGLTDPYSLLFRNLIRKEKLLKDSETRYRTVADNTYDWEFWTNPEREFVYVSPSAKTVTSHPAEDFLSDPRLFQEIVHPADRHLFEKHRLEAEHRKIPGDLEFRIIHQNGSVRWIAHVCQPVFDANRNFLGIRGNNRDVTRRKKAEEKLRAAHENLEKKVKYRTKELREANRQLEQDKEQLIEFYKYAGTANRKISILLDLYKAPFGKRNRQGILRYITSTILNISRASVAFLYGYDKNQKSFNLLNAQSGESGDKSNDGSISAKSKVFLEAFRRNPRRIYGRIEKNYREIFQGENKLKYFMALPLENDKKLTGLIFLGFRNKRSISPQDFEFYDIFSIIVSQALASGYIKIS